MGIRAALQGLDLRAFGGLIERDLAQSRARGLTRAAADSMAAQQVAAPPARAGAG